MSYRPPSRTAKFPIDPVDRRRARRGVALLTAAAALLWAGLILAPAVLPPDPPGRHPVAVPSGP